jgi:hypothetical protein
VVDAQGVQAVARRRPWWGARRGNGSDQGWRGRNEGRNVAFADLLWSSGLRLARGRLAVDDRSCQGWTPMVATMCAGASGPAVAKMRRGRDFWLSRSARSRHRSVLGVESRTGRRARPPRWALRHRRTDFWSRRARGSGSPSRMRHVVQERTVLVGDLLCGTGCGCSTSRTPGGSLPWCSLASRGCRWPRHVGASLRRGVTPVPVAGRPGDVPPAHAAPLVRVTDAAHA